MERDEAIRRAEIAMAWARGESVQYHDGDENWTDESDCDGKDSPLFFHADYFWRIKPKPLECWVWVIENVAHNAVMNCTDKPISPPRGCMVDGRWVRMVEPQ